MSSASGTQHPDRQPGNVFLEGVFAPVPQERTLGELTVRGFLPPELNGLYVRIGPNPMHVKNVNKHHWFAGDGMVHGVQLDHSVARWYRNRYVASHSVQKRLQRPILPGHTRGVFDTVNTNVYSHAGRIWASVEAGPSPVELSPELETIRHGLFDSQFNLPFSAHPHLDPLTGDLHAICYDAIQHKLLRYMRVNASGAVDKIVNIPVEHGPMVHDCAITASKVIVLDLPVTFSWWSLLKRETFPYHWNNKHPARIGLLPREGDAQDIRWIKTDPCFIFHVCNAYDLADGSVVMDAIVHAHMFDKSRVGPETNTRSQFERWHISAKSDHIQREVIHDQAQEFPRLNERLVGQPYRYAYTVEFDVDQSGGQHLFKHDLQSRTLQQLQLGEDLKLGEFVFVPKSKTDLTSPKEDEGWLLGYAHHTQEERTELFVIDAQTLQTQAVVDIPCRIPMGFHGNWIHHADLHDKPKQG